MSDLPALDALGVALTNAATDESLCEHGCVDSRWCDDCAAIRAYLETQNEGGPSCPQQVT